MEQGIGGVWHIGHDVSLEILHHHVGWGGWDGDKRLK